VPGVPAGLARSTIGLRESAHLGSPGCDVSGVTGAKYAAVALVGVDDDVLKQLVTVATT
jgi:hypothetical protein